VRGSAAPDHPPTPTEILASGTDKQKLDLVRRLIAEQISAFQHRGNVVICGSATLADRLHAKIAPAVLNGVPALDVLIARIVAAIEAEAPKTKKHLAPESDPDLAGPFNMLPCAKRWPGRKRVTQYGLDPQGRYNRPDEYEESATAPTSAAKWQSRTQGRTVASPGKKARTAYDRLQTPLAPAIERSNDPNMGGPETQFHPKRVLDSATLDSLDDSFLWNAREHGLRLIVRRDLNLGITSKQLLAAALEMSQERISAELLDPLARKSRAKVPAFPKWTEVAARLKLHPRTAQIAAQKLKAYPPNKLFELVAVEDSL
jgi:hypothetical protein